MYSSDDWVNYFYDFIENSQYNKEQKETSMKINWKNQPPKPRHLYYDDLKLNDAFRLTTGQAIYIKVAISPKLSGTKVQVNGMLELATGQVFHPSESPVELISVEINIDSAKPNIY